MALPQPRPATVRDLRGGGIKISNEDGGEPEEGFGLKNLSELSCIHFIRLT